MDKFINPYYSLVSRKNKLWLYNAVNILSFTILLFSCKSNHKTLFSTINSKHSRINFINQVDYTEKINTYTYRNFYNGAGVGLADFNNDGLTDIYFCGNMTGNRIYLNTGNFIFEDITARAGVSGGGSWSTGVSIADINADGWPDIYVCKSGDPLGPDRKNELFINNGDLTFREEAAKYGLDVLGLSNHAAFFDYDRDGDLDCYLLNNSFNSVTSFDAKAGSREIRDILGGNRLFRNDNGYFNDISSEAGIYGSKIGFGLGVSISDINLDGWPDIYVSNDFFERDYLYINNGNGTFTESLDILTGEISLGAMGSDIADINNDAQPDIFVTEMTPEDNSRRKTKALFEDWNTYNEKVRNGYFHQFARNTLQLNNGNGAFSEIGRFAGVSSTDWSWGALIMDMDNDGWKDIFVANGIYKDLLDRDYLDIYSDPLLMRTLMKTDNKAIINLIGRIPSVKIPNYAFHNNGNLTFSNLAAFSGLGAPSWSNGAAYGDLDNDGDLDLVVNNVNMPPFLYRNETDNNKASNFLVLNLRGTRGNTFSIGSTATVYYQGRMNYNELFPNRGFQSCVENRLHFGLGSASLIDSLIVNWPDGKCTKIFNLPANQFLTLYQNEASEKRMVTSVKTTPIFTKTEINGMNFYHHENDFNDFDRDRLIFRMISNEGPHFATGDINGDALTDMFICGAKDSPGELFVQNRNGHFQKTNTRLFESDRISEDTDCTFFDADGDDDEDLYVTSGGNEFPSSSSALADRLYLNDGKGIFSKTSQILPAGKYESSSCVEPDDFDHDGDIDLFVGIRLKPFEYGLPANGYILENDGKGNFNNITSSIAPELINAGMITDMTWADVDNDKDDDIIITGEWMPIRVFINQNGIFTEETEKYGLKESNGLWHRIVARDLNNDGLIDFIIGNDGLNTGFYAKPEKPLEMFVNDFDMNGSIDQVICMYNGRISYPVALKDDMVNQIPSLGAKYKKYDTYKDQTITDIFPQEVLKRSLKLKVKMLQSIVMINIGKSSFRLIPLPVEAQFSPVYAIEAEDFDNDGYCDIIVGGNQYRAKPETGINDASHGLYLKGSSNLQWKAVPPMESGIFIKGEIRDFALINVSGQHIIAAGLNNDNLQLYKY